MTGGGDIGFAILMGIASASTFAMSGGGLN